MDHSRLLWFWRCFDLFAPVKSARALAPSYESDRTRRIRDKFAQAIDYDKPTRSVFITLYDAIFAHFMKRSST